MITLQIGHIGALKLPSEFGGIAGLLLTHDTETVECLGPATLSSVPHRRLRAAQLAVKNLKPAAPAPAPKKAPAPVAAKPAVKPAPAKAKPATKAPAKKEK